MRPNYYKTMAEELERILSALPAAAQSRPTTTVVESHIIAAEPTAPANSENNDHLIPQLVKSVVDYSVSRAPDRATAEDIGLAIAAGINEAVKHLDVDRDKVIESVGAFLDELTESALSSLDE